MRNHRDAIPATIGDLFPNAQTDPTPPIRRSRAVPALVGLSLLLGLLTAGVAAPAVGASGLVTREASTYFLNLPTDLPQLPLPRPSKVLAADGTAIATFNSENRVLVPLAKVPSVVTDALIATEDSRFRTHNGVDLKGTVRALKNNASTGETQGGSTLTQQYVKQILLQAATSEQDREAVTSRTSYLRKLREARYAMALEQKLTKDQILEGYLNIVYFGDGAYGIGAASQHFFHKDVADLTLPEAALLAGLVQNPNGYNPAQHPKAATARRAMVLDRMVAVGKITPEQATKAKATKVKLRLYTPANGCSVSKHPFYCQWVKQTLLTDPTFGKTPQEREQRLFRGGMTIRTALDPKAQKIAQTAVDKALGRDNRVAGVSVTVRPGTGEVVAMAVNRDWGQGKGQTEMVLPTARAMQPGSTMKAFTLGAAFERGSRPSTVWNAPTRYFPAGQASPPGGFRNSAGWDAGAMNAYTAIARSSNTWFVHLQRDAGVRNVADFATRMGLSGLPLTGKGAITDRDASFTLGSHEVSPLDVANSFATLAAHGVACKPVAITAITGPDGRPVAVPDPDCHQAAAPGVADTVTDLLRGVVDGKDPHRTGRDLAIGRPVAAKSGTTDANSAVWFTGYTPQYATSVWLGDPRGAHAYPLNTVRLYGSYTGAAYGGTVAGPIWEAVMKGLHKGQPVKTFRAADPFVLAGYSQTLPDVRGLTRDKAIEVLQSAGFNVRINKARAKADPLIPAGQVAATIPSAGTTTGWGTTVALTLTHGSDRNVTIPPLRAPDTSAEPATRAPGTTDLGNGIVTKGE